MELENEFAIDIIISTVIIANKCIAYCDVKNEHRPDELSIARAGERERETSIVSQWLMDECVHKIRSSQCIERFIGLPVSDKEWCSQPSSSAYIALY